MATQDEDSMSLPAWYIGLHDPDNDSTSAESLQNANYDMTAIPATTPEFYRTVRELLVSFNARLREEGTQRDQVPLPVIPALTPLHSKLSPGEATSQRIVMSSPWIDLGSADPVVAELSRQAFNLEIAYIAFCGVQNVIIPGPNLTHGEMCVEGFSRYARAIQEALVVSNYINFQILLPMAPGLLRNTSVLHSKMENLSIFAEPNVARQRLADEVWGSWEAWNLVRSVCNYSQRLSVALVVPKQLPSASLQSRWYSESPKMLVLPESTFIPNKYSQPVLAKSHQGLLTRYMRLHNAPWLLLSNLAPVPPLNIYSDPTPAEAASAASHKVAQSVSADPSPQLSYLRVLQKKQPSRPAIERYGAGYQDYLQMPLQPLSDNLESITYEVFEKDPIKYEWYEQAICSALKDWIDQEKPTSAEDGKIVIAVVGAGRGPLVARALHAAEIVFPEVEVWAVEKNPNAYVLLQTRNRENWDSKVHVVKSDMRTWKGPLRPDGTHGKVDILVSELLGSFADNELSPECLDGVQHVLNPECGISIPESYTAFLTPISTPRLFSELSTKGTAELQPFEIPYVVMLHAYDFLSYEADEQPGKSQVLEPPSDKDPTLHLKTPIVKPCWTFRHPQSDAVLQQSSVRRGGSAEGGGGGTTGGEGANAHNTRFAQLSFPCPKRGVCHGFAGYFETVLYASTVLEEDSDDEQTVVELSTNPLTMDRKSKDMISWFPIFFPVKVVPSQLPEAANRIKEPIQFPDNSELQVSLWRQTDDRKVWYEWLVELFVDIDDTLTRVGSSNLHSSKKHGCVM